MDDSINTSSAPALSITVLEEVVADTCSYQCKSFFEPSHENKYELLAQFKKVKSTVKRDVEELKLALSKTHKEVSRLRGESKRMMENIGKMEKENDELRESLAEQKAAYVQGTQDIQKLVAARNADKVHDLDKLMGELHLIIERNAPMDMDKENVEKVRT